MRTLVIDGQLVPAQAGEELSVEDPSTATVTHCVPLGRDRDALAAIEAARVAFDDGPWPRMTPQERGAVLDRLGSLLEENLELFTQIGEDEIGTPRRMSPGTASPTLPPAPEAANSLAWNSATAARPGARIGSAIPRPPGRYRSGHHGGGASRVLAS